MACGCELSALQQSLCGSQVQESERQAEVCKSDAYESACIVRNYQDIPVLGPVIVITTYDVCAGTCSGSEPGNAEAPFDCTPYTDASASAAYDNAISECEDAASSRESEIDDSFCGEDGPGQCSKTISTCVAEGYEGLNYKTCTCINYEDDDDECKLTRTECEDSQGQGIYIVNDDCECVRLGDCNLTIDKCLQQGYDKPFIENCYCFESGKCNVDVVYCIDQEGFTNPEVIGSGSDCYCREKDTSCTDHVCPPGRYEAFYNESTAQCDCRCACDDGFYCDGTECRCIVPCPSGLIIDEVTCDCSCPSGEVRVPGTDRCIPETTCIPPCSGDKVCINDDCVCPDGRLEDEDGNCVYYVDEEPCDDGLILCGVSCVSSACDTGEIWDEDECDCLPGTCPGNLVRNPQSGACECPSGQRLVDGTDDQCEDDITDPCHGVTVDASLCERCVQTGDDTYEIETCITGFVCVNGACEAEPQCGPGRVLNAARTGCEPLCPGQVWRSDVGGEDGGCCDPCGEGRHQAPSNGQCRCLDSDIEDIDEEEDQIQDEDIIAPTCPSGTLWNGISCVRDTRKFIPPTLDIVRDYPDWTPPPDWSYTPISHPAPWPAPARISLIDTYLNYYDFLTPGEQMSISNWAHNAKHYGDCYQCD